MRLSQLPPNSDATSGASQTTFTPGTVARLFLDGMSVHELAGHFQSTVREIEGFIRAVMIRQARRKHSQ